MSSPTTDQRAKGWNVQFFIGTNPIAGIYQYADFLSVGDVARDLDLCLVFELPSHCDDWRPVLLPRAATTGTNAIPSASPILLDKTNTQPFPGPESGVAQYTYLLHSKGLCISPGGSVLHANDSLFAHSPPYGQPS